MLVFIAARCGAISRLFAAWLFSMLAVVAYLTKHKSKILAEKKRLSMRCELKG